MTYADMFRDVENFAVLKRFQRDLYALTGLTFDFLDKQSRHSLPLRAAAAFTPFCRFVNRSKLGHQACEDCTRTGVEQCQASRKAVIQHCHLGLVDLYIPITFRDTVVGVFCTGQFRLKQPTITGFERIRRRLVQLGVNPSLARVLYRQAPVMPKVKVDAILDLVRVVLDYIVAEEQILPVVTAATGQDKVSQARAFIESHYAESISLDDVAAAIHLSPSRLSHLFKEAIDTTLTAYLHDVRLHWACYLLANTSLRIGEIAGKVGFNHLSHFNRLFVKKIGLSPLRYRRQQKSAKK